MYRYSRSGGGAYLSTGSTDPHLCRGRQGVWVSIDIGGQEEFVCHLGDNTFMIE